MAVPKQPQRFTKNEAIFAGAVLLHTGAEASIERCDFHDNVAEVGGAIFAEKAQSDINGCGFHSNFAEVGGAIFTDEGEADITSSTKFECNGAFLGGAMLNFLGDIDISDGGFTNNNAFAGGALFIDGANTNIDDSFFDQNSGFGGGAIAYFDFERNGTHAINDTVFQNNTALGTPGADIIDESPEDINCGTGFDNCFCDANPASLPNITTNEPPTTCSNDGVGSGCSGCIQTPLSTCAPSSRAGTATRAGSWSNQKMDMDDMHAMIEGKMKSREGITGVMKEKMDTAMKKKG